MKKIFRQDELLRHVHLKEQKSNNRRLCTPEETAAYSRIAQAAQRGVCAEDPLAIRAEFLRQFGENMPIVEDEYSPFCGSRCFDPAADKGYRAHGHSIIDWECLLQKGPEEIENDILAMKDSGCKAAFLTTIRAFRGYIRRHKGCEELADRAPRDFFEALQLIWFGQIFLRAEGASAAISLGRMDKYLLPFAETCSDDTIIALLTAWFAKCCEGDESQNVTLGEAPSDRLTILFLKAMRLSRLWQPSFSLRVAADTSQAVWDEALALTASGSGQPSYFNSSVVMSSLKELDIPDEKLSDWAIVGCYEAVIPGETAPFTVAGALHLPDVLMSFLKGIDEEPVDFSAFTEDFLNYFCKCDWYGFFAAVKEKLKQSSVTPFESLMMKDCIRKGKYLSDCGARYNTLGVNILGIGTLLDSMLTIKQRVYTDRSVTLKELTEQTLNDQPGCKTGYPFFGQADPEIEHFASYISTELCKCLLKITLPDGTRLAPSFFRFGVDIMQDLQATPDGRKSGERVSYGCMPSEWHELAPTERLRAAAQISHNLTPNGSPAMISVSKTYFSPDSIKALISGYFALGGSHLHLNIQDKQTLLDAKEHPEFHGDLLVRVSGYSATFVKLAPRWQQALIDRMEK